jgi:hypothetical protein
MLRALLDGSLPTAPTIALAAARRYRTVLKTPTLSADTRAYLQSNPDELERRANDPTRLDEEAQHSPASRPSRPKPQRGRRLRLRPPALHPTPLPGRTLLKVGCSDRDVIMRFRSRTRTTALLRIYRTNRDLAAPGEATFRRLPDAVSPEMSSFTGLTDTKTGAGADEPLYARTNSLMYVGGARASTEHTKRFTVGDVAPPPLGCVTSSSTTRTELPQS